ncbi:hypothetical protein [Yoonia sp.]|uniref:hypothetical protein n=1 Tax=Yoonia sp. TaxID=2212373 RepID=UPI0025CF63DE|nr:hypothetical protein [Yoonia sp.]
MKHIRWVWWAACLLCGCGGGGGDGGGSGIDPRLARLDIYEAQKLRVLGDPGAGVMGMAVTPDVAVPDSGNATFDGSATIRIEAANALVLFGDAAVTVAFDTAAVSGTLDGFFGTDSGNAVLDYAGAITIDGGGVGGATDSDLHMDYGGGLTAPGEALIFDGTLTGSFLGNPLAAIATADLAAVVDHNGTLTDATILVIGELALTSP